MRPLCLSAQWKYLVCLAVHNIIVMRPYTLFITILPVLNEREQKVTIKKEEMHLGYLLFIAVAVTRIVAKKWRQCGLSHSLF